MESNKEQISRTLEALINSIEQQEEDRKINHSLHHKEILSSTQSIIKEIEQLIPQKDSFSILNSNYQSKDRTLS